MNDGMFREATAKLDYLLLVAAAWGAAQVVGYPDKPRDGVEAKMKQLRGAVIVAYKEACS